MAVPITFAKCYASGPRLSGKIPAYLPSAGKNKICHKWSSSDSTLRKLAVDHNYLNFITIPIFFNTAEELCPFDCNKRHATKFLIKIRWLAEIQVFGSDPDASGTCRTADSQSQQGFLWRKCKKIFSANPDLRQLA